MLHSVTIAAGVVSLDGGGQPLTFGSESDERRFQNPKERRLLLMLITDLITVFEFMITCVLLGIELRGILTKDDYGRSSKHKKK